MKGRGERRVVYLANNFYTIVENEIDVESSIDVKSKMISNLTRSGFESEIDRKCKKLRSRRWEEEGDGEEEEEEEEEDDEEEKEEEEE